MILPYCSSSGFSVHPSKLCPSFEEKPSRVIITLTDPANNSSKCTITKLVCKKQLALLLLLLFCFIIHQVS